MPDVAPFFIGDKVRFEVAPNGLHTRYTYDQDTKQWIDHGESGDFAEGSVTSLLDNILTITGSYRENPFEVGFPMTGHEMYVNDFYEWPGNPIPPRLKANNVDPKCTCGVKITGGYHSDWCDLVQEK